VKKLKATFVAKITATIAVKLPAKGSSTTSRVTGGVDEHGEDSSSAAAT
jgi:hypothetical protein